MAEGQSPPQDLEVSLRMAVPSSFDKKGIREGGGGSAMVVKQIPKCEYYSPRWIMVVVGVVGSMGYDRLQIK